MLVACENTGEITKFEPAGVILSPVSGPTSEGGDSASFTLVLASQPQSNVVINLASSNTNEGTLDKGTVAFTASDWNISQTVTVKGVDDSVSDGNQPFEITFDLASSQDPSYSALRLASLVVVNIDNDQAGFVVGQVSGPTAESQTQSEFSVRLTSQPQSDVTLNFDSDDSTEGIIDGPKSITFTPDDWNAMNKIIRVRGVEDKIADGNQPYRVVFSETSSDDVTYAAIKPADVLVINLDDDTSGINVSAVSGPTTETGASATFSVVLASEPEADVVLSIASNDSSEGTTDLSQLTFTKVNWNAAQNVSVTGVDDEIADGNQPYAVEFSAVTSTDATYAAIMPADVVVINIDDDRAGINVSAISGPTTEAGGTATFTVALASEPEDNVTVNFDTDDNSEGTVSSNSLIFTAMNWNAPQTITVTGVDDSVADGNQPFRIVFSNTVSTDATYAAITPNTVSVINTDNDNAEILVDSISGPTSEGDIVNGTFASFSIQLTSAPTDTVTISFDSTDQSEGRVDQTSVVFTPTNWSAQQVVRVTGQEDLLADGDQTYRIRFSSVSSNDLTYDAQSLSDIVVVNNDNDTAGISVSRVEGFTTESGGQVTFTVSLTSEPSADVTVSFSSDDTAEGTVAPNSLIFTPVNWNAPQSVTVTGVDDSIADGNQPYRIVFGATVSNDATYAAITPQSIVVINTDDDSAGILVSPISGPTTEGGDTATFTVALTSRPSDDVTLSLVSSDTTEGDISATSLIFTAVNWNAPQTVTVTGADDQIADGNQTYVINFTSVVSNDLAYATLSPSGVTVVNTDNDSAGVTVSAISGPTTEAGGTATFTVQLNSQPTAVVQISPESTDTNEGTVSPGTLSFTSATWNVPQTITITGQDDVLVDGNQPYAIQFQPNVTSDVAYAAISIPPVPVINVDNDTAGVTVSQMSGPVSEDQVTATFTVVLNSQPSADVTISMSSSDTGEGTISTGSLVFTNANWNAPQTVTVTGVDDQLADGTQVFQVQFGAVQSTDTNFGNLAINDLSVFNVDNDTAGVVFSNLSSPTTEDGGQATFTVRLQTEPQSTVTLAFASNDTGEGSSSPSSLVFTPNDWDTPQTITVTGQDDSLKDGDQPYQIVFSAIVSGDADYAGIVPAPVLVFNTDNDTAGFEVSQASGPTGEDGTTATFTVRLRTQPSDDVTISFLSSDIGEGILGQSSLTFTAQNWDSFQTVILTGQDDELADGNQPYQVTFGTSTSNDTNYDGITPASVNFLNLDDDSAGFLISSPSAPTTEDGGQATFTVRLQSEPQSSVTLTYSSSDTTEGTLNISSINFSPSNWDSPQTVTVIGEDDELADGDQSYQINFAAAVSSDANYNGLIPASVTMFNNDNDTAGFELEAMNGPVSEDGAIASFSARLRTEPSSDVTVDVVSSDTTEGVVSVSSLTFTPSNWDSSQIIFVTGVNDNIADGNQSFTVTLSIDSTSDANYGALSPASVSVLNLDNDTAGFLLSDVSAPTTENGGTATFTVRLQSEPSSDVTISYASDDPTEGVTSGNQMTFTTANWNAPQTVTVTGQDDGIADGDQTYRVVFNPAVSNDTNYSGLTPPAHPLFNNDNDTAAIDIGRVSGPTSESGGTATFTVVLRTQPTSDVTVLASSSDVSEVSVNVSAVTFTPNNWNAAQTVTLTGVDDQVADGNQTVSINFSQATSADLSYSGLTPPSIPVTNLDNESAGITVSDVIATTSESGQSGSFRIALTSKPSSDVTIPVSSSDAGEATVSVSNVVFTTSTWNTIQTVTVTGVDDQIDDGTQNYQIQFGSTTSVDTSYNGLSIAPLSFSNVDNENAGFIVSQLSGPTSESGTTATFTVALASQPASSVEISPVSSDATEATISPTSLTFSTSNWNVAQTVTLTGVDDQTADGNQTYNVTWGLTSSTDTDYAQAVIPQRTGVNLDNDTAGLALGALSQPTTEAGDQGTFTVVLTSQPTDSVTVGLSSSDTTEGTVSTPSLTFSTSNWDTPQTVTVTGVDDNVVDGTRVFNISFVLTSSDLNYSGLAVSDASVPNVDNDVVGLTVTDASGVTTESGGTTTASVTLTSEPQGSVTVGVLSSDTTEGIASPSSIVFDSNNWNVPQLVTVTGVDDADADGAQNYVINVSVSASSDPVYSPAIPVGVIPLVNTDDDFSLNIPSTSSVLVYATTGLGIRFDDAMNNLGVDFTVTTTSSEFVTAFDQGGFDLVIVDESSVTLSNAMIQRLLAWTNRGQRLILNYQNLANHSDLMTAVGVAAVATTNQPNILPDRTLPIRLFDLPVQVGQTNTWNSLPYLLAPSTPSTEPVVSLTLGFASGEIGHVLARYDDSFSGDPAILLTKQGRVFVNGFVNSVYGKVDADYDSIHDVREVIENQVLYFYSREETGIREDMTRIPAGTFQMGASLLDPHQASDEYDRTVTLTRDFLLGKTSVPSRLYLSLTGTLPSSFTASCGFDCPVNGVTWSDAVEFANSLSVREGRTACYVESAPGDWDDIDLDCNGYRLPTEAEWEYAAKGGTTTMTYNGDFSGTGCGQADAAVLTPIAWYSCNDSGSPRPVGLLQPNNFGLYDMLGNTYDWVNDAYGFYAFTSETDPLGVLNPTPTANRVVRGGQYNSSPTVIRATNRNSIDPTQGYTTVGFRLAQTNVPIDSFVVESESGASAPAGAGTPVTFSSSDNSIALLDLPFTFNYLGSDYTDLWVSTNGVIAFDSISLGTPTNRPIPLGGPPYAFIAGWWDDLVVPSSGSVTTEETGVSPNRVFTVHFDDLDRAFGVGTVNLTFRLYETSNVIEVHYNNITGTSWNATAGWEASSPETRGADVLGCFTGCDETNFPTGQILRYKPIRVR